MITIPAVLAKADFAGVLALKGLANDLPLTLRGVQRAKGLVVFQGFRDGEANAEDHLFYGNLYFDVIGEQKRARIL